VFVDTLNTQQAAYILELFPPSYVNC